MLISSPASLHKQASKPFGTTVQDSPYFRRCWSLDITGWLAISWSCSHQKTKFPKLPRSQSYPMLPYSDFCLYIKALKEKVKVPRHSKKNKKKLGLGVRLKLPHTLLHTARLYCCCRMVILHLPFKPTQRELCVQVYKD